MRPELLTQAHILPECLMTLVFRADLNGWLGTGHSESWGPAKWIASCIRNAFIDPLLMSIISIRELVRPLSCEMSLNNCRFVAHRHTLLSRARQSLPPNKCIGSGC